MFISNEYQTFHTNYREETWNVLSRSICSLHQRHPWMLH